MPKCVWYRGGVDAVSFVVILTVFQRQARRAHDAGFGELVFDIDDFPDARRDVRSGR